MSSPEERAKKKMKDVGYNPVRDDIEEEATKEIMKSEIKEELAKIGLKAQTPEEVMDE